MTYVDTWILHLHEMVTTSALAFSWKGYGCCVAILKMVPTQYLLIMVLMSMCPKTYLALPQLESNAGLRLQRCKGVDMFFV